MPNPKLYVARKENNLKQSDLAKKLSISKQTYYRKEKGVSEFTQREMVMLAKIFNCTLNELFWEEDNHGRNKTGLIETAEKARQIF